MKFFNKSFLIIFFLFIFFCVSVFGKGLVCSSGSMFVGENNTLELWDGFDKFNFELYFSNPNSFVVSYDIIITSGLEFVDLKSSSFVVNVSPGVLNEVFVLPVRLSKKMLVGDFGVINYKIVCNGLMNESGLAVVGRQDFKKELLVSKVANRGVVNVKNPNANYVANIDLNTSFLDRLGLSVWLLVGSCLLIIIGLSGLTYFFYRRKKVFVVNKVVS